MTKSRRIYETLLSGDSYTNPDNNTIIPYNEAEKDKYKKEVYADNEKINYRFLALLNEFNQYIMNKNRGVRNSDFYEPMKLVLPTRVGISRQAKGQVGYSGSTSSNTEGEKKKKFM